MELGTSSWLADGVKEIERLTKAAMIVEPKIIPIPQERPGTYGIVTPGPAGTANTITVKTAGPLWHNERLDDPKQLIAFIGSMSARGVKPETGAVYIGESSIVYVYDFEDRRHRAICPLTVSKPWAWLRVDQKPMTQKEIIRELRIMFDGCLPRDSNLISLLRNVRWSAAGDADVNVQRGKEALGLKITREATGISDFPEEFTLTVGVFENVAQNVTVRVALELLPDTQRFEVIPFPNQIHNGMAETLQWLQEDISKTKVPTFIGSVTGGKGSD